jgi:hypothetical protein
MLLLLLVAARERLRLRRRATCPRPCTGLDGSVVRHAGRWPPRHTWPALRTYKCHSFLGVGTHLRYQSRFIGFLLITLTHNLYDSLIFNLNEL